MRVALRSVKRLYLSDQEDGPAATPKEIHDLLLLLQKERTLDVVFDVTPEVPCLPIVKLLERSLSHDHAKGALERCGISSRREVHHGSVAQGEPCARCCYAKSIEAVDHDQVLQRCSWLHNGTAHL